MKRCFLIPMTDPPYSYENSQRPKYLHEMRISWTGVPLFKKNIYLVMVNTSLEKLQLLQENEDVIDFPNIDDDTMDNLPDSRKLKNKNIHDILKIPTKDNEKVRDFINRAANSEVDHKWNKDELYVHNED